MANEIRLRSNNKSGTITDNPLAQVSTTINSAAFTTLPTVAGTNHLILILDPLAINGVPEIVMVTAHTAAATSVTVTRGAEGSTPRAHILGTTWFHGPVTTDHTEVLTSGTRPAVPYTGELLYETDTGKYQSYNGTAWVQRDAGGTLGYASVTGGTTAGITTVVDLASLSVTVTVGTSRRIKITGEIECASSSADDTARLQIQEAATVLQTCDQLMRPANVTNKMITTSILTPTAGSHTYKLTLQRILGAGTLTHSFTAGVVSQILVEDIGAM